MHRENLHSKTTAEIAAHQYDIPNILYVWGKTRKEAKGTSD